MSSLSLAFPDVVTHSLFRELAGSTSKRSYLHVASLLTKCLEMPCAEPAMHSTATEELRSNLSSSGAMGAEAIERKEKKTLRR